MLLQFIFIALFQCINSSDLNYFSKFFEEFGVKKKYNDLDCYSHFATNMEIPFESFKKDLKDNSFSDISKVKQEKIYYFGGACYYISNLSLTWNSSLSLCQKIGRNNYSSLYKYDNDKELSFLKNKIGEIFINDSRLVEDNSDIEKKTLQIVFTIGLRKRKNSTLLEWFNHLNSSNINEFLNHFNKKNEEETKDKMKGQIYVIILKKNDENQANFILASDREENTKGRPFICKYVIDYCSDVKDFCDNGYCYNSIKKGRSECKCHSFYYGEKCEKRSIKLYQIYACLGIICLFIVSMFIFSQAWFIRKCFGKKNDRVLVQNLDRSLNSIIKYEGFNIVKTYFVFFRKYPKILVFLVSSLILTFTLALMLPSIKIYFNQERESFLNEANYTLSDFKKSSFVLYSRICHLKSNYLIENYLFVIASLPLTAFIYFWNMFSFKFKQKEVKLIRKLVFKSEKDEKLKLKEMKNKKQTYKDVKEPVVKYFNFKINFDLIIPNNPFSKTNRLLNCIIYSAYVYTILKIFGFSTITIYKHSFVIQNVTAEENSIFNVLDQFQSFSNSGILIDLLIRITNVFVIGVQFYPVLLCAEFKTKSKLCYFLCCVFAWSMFVYTAFSNELCDSDEISFDYIVAIFKEIMSYFLQTILNRKFNSTLFNSSFEIIRLTTLNKTQGFITKRTDDIKNFTYQSNETNNLVNLSQNFFNNSYSYENLIFYSILCSMSATLTIDFFLLVINQMIRFKRKSLNTAFDDIQLEYETDDEYEIGQCKAELNYTLSKFKENNQRNSYVKYLIDKYIYKNNNYFRFSKQFLTIKAISLVLLAYLTMFFIKKSLWFSRIIVMLLTFLIDNSFENIAKDKLIAHLEIITLEINDCFVIACALTTTVYIIQLLLSIRCYQTTVLKAYKGVYTNIPNPKKYSSAKLASSSLHFSGYSIGLLLIGFTILNFVNFFLIGFVKIVYNVKIILFDLTKYVLPFIAVFLIKKYLVNLLCKYYIMNKTGRNVRLKRKKTYQIVSHYNFIFDSFLVFFSSTLRFVYSIMLALFFLPRLDYTTFGLEMHRFDIGYMSYVGFLHLEVNQTHPIKLAFCELIKRSVKNQTNQLISDNKKMALNKWHLAYTLYKNPHLKKERKTVFTTSRNQYDFIKDENFQGYLKRIFKK